jgi:hypothetical protein
MSQENVEVVRRVLKSRRDRGIMAREQGDERRILMKLRPWLAVVACVIGVSLIPATAVADPPTKDEESPVGDTIDCDGTVLEVISGTIVTRTHVHELKSGRFRVIFVSLPKGVTAEDEEGVVYRVVGPTHANFTTSDPESEEPTGDEIGFFHQKLNFIGPGGLFGTLDFRLSRKKKDEFGDFTMRDKGNCEFVDEE